MDDIIELTDDRDHDILTETASGGLLGGTFLHDDPLSSYLEDDEVPKFVLRNKKSGFEKQQESGSESITPGSDYQALLLVTDLNLRFVVGQDGGDSVELLPLDEIFEARSESGGFRTKTLEIETFDGITYRFPVKSSTETVADTIDAMAQSWVSAVRLLEDAESEIENADAILTGQETTKPADETEVQSLLASAEKNLTTASNRIRDVGPGAQSYVRERIESLTETLLPLFRHLRGEQAGTAHSRALTAWDESDFEVAASQYEIAVEFYSDALEADGEIPTDNVLYRRRRAARRERELLRVWPQFEADAARRQAISVEDSGTAAKNWQRALEGYKGLLSLDWEDSEREFVIHDDRIRKQVQSVADDAILDYYTAGTEQIHAGDGETSTTAQNEHYEQAREHFEQARQLVTEVHPPAVDTVETALFTVDRRIEGNVPAEPADPIVPSLSLDEADEESADGTHTSAPQKRQSTRETHTSETTRRQNPVGAGSVHRASEEPSSGGPDDQDTSETSPMERLKSQKSTDATDGTDEAEQGTLSGSTTDSTPPEPTDDGPTIEDEIRESLLALEEATFTEFVSDLWEKQGWSTTVFSGTPSAVYDIVAIRNEPNEEKERLLIWTVHRPDGGDIGSTVIKRCATSRESSQGTDNVTLVTTGSVSRSAESTALDLDVTVVNCNSLIQRVKEAELADELRQLGQQTP